MQQFSSRMQRLASVTLLSLVWLFVGQGMVARAQWVSSTNIADLYPLIGFNPRATNCGLLLQVNDIHMSFNPVQLSPVVHPNNPFLADYWSGGPHTRMTLAAEFLQMLNAMDPQPDAMVVVGDLAIEHPVAFGAAPKPEYGIPELIAARDELAKLTNFPVYIVPGNHDGDATEIENAQAFNSIFTNTPRFTNFVVAGLPVLAMHGHNGGYLDREQVEWLASFRSQLDHNRPVVLAVHQPPLSEPNIARDFLWFLKPWTAPVYLMSGHTHSRLREAYPFGRTELYNMVCPAFIGSWAWGQWHTPQPYDPEAPGFFVWCITNGTVAGVLSGFIPIPATNHVANSHPWLTNSMYYLFDTAVQPALASPPYHSWTNMLFHVEEGYFDRAEYELQVLPDRHTDAYVLRCYVHTYRCRLPVERYPMATHALMQCTIDAGVQFSFSQDATNWTFVPMERYFEAVASVPIPPSMRQGPLYFRMTRPDLNGFVYGFGLLTTNAQPAITDWLAKHAGDSYFNKDDPLPRTGVPAWITYILGIDAWHPDEFRAQPGWPQGGGWPSRINGVLRFGMRTNLTYTIDLSSALEGPWQPATGLTLGPAQQGWREVTSSNDPALFYRIQAR